MPQSELTTRRAVARNLRTLMKRHNLSQPQLAKRSGVSQRHISNILNEQSEVGVEKLDKLAKAFGLKGWQMQMPNIPDELLDSDLLGTIVQSVAEATPEGRDYIAKTAIREAHFSKNK